MFDSIYNNICWVFYKYIIPFRINEHQSKNKTQLLNQQNQETSKLMQEASAIETQRSQVQPVQIHKQLLHARQPHSQQS